jgi:hypothetical protein
VSDREQLPRLTVSDLEFYRRAALYSYEGGDPTYWRLPENVHRYLTRPDGGLIDLIDMAIGMARDIEKADAFSHTARTVQFLRGTMIGAHGWLLGAGYPDQLSWDIAKSIVKAQYRAEADWRCSDQLLIDLAVIDSIRDDYRSDDTAQDGSPAREMEEQ